MNLFVPQRAVLVHRTSAFDFFSDSEDRAAAMALLEARVTQILATEGASALAMPRDAAAAHEAGHAVVAHRENLRVRRVEIFEAPITGPAAAVFGTAWGGRTSYRGKKWLIDPATNPVKDLMYARVTIAGLAAEVVFGVARSGSSLDEAIVAQAMTATAAAKFGVGAEVLWGKVFYQALEICDRNRKVISAVAERLMEFGSVANGALRDLLDDVDGRSS